MTTAAVPTTPFTIQHTPQVPEILAEIGCSLALTTYQAGKVILLASDGERLIQLPRTFEEPMGLAIDGDRMAVATKSSIVVLTNDSRLAETYPRQPATYDALFVPRSVHYAGTLAVHDMLFTDHGLVGVNTLFSCLFQLDARFSFRPVWKPPFVSALAPEDRCHLNGLAAVGKEIRYATALGRTDVAGGWREGKERGGVLMHVPSGEIVVDGLAMPHSPRVYDGQLYILLSSTGEFAAVDVGRKQHTFGDLAIAGRKDLACGITLVHLPSAAIVGELRYVRSCEEIYDVQILPSWKRPGLLGLHDETHLRALAIPEQTFWGAEREEKR